ncbi:MAG: trypsin-like peptidase domain-containing protein [Arenimonas sp.]
MRLRQLRGEEINDPLVGTAPIFKLGVDGSTRLIGTGFWVTTVGHLITAWHVIEDNIGKDGVDEGPIFAIQTLLDRKLITRTFRKSDKHETYDLALTETTEPFDGSPPTIPHVLTLDEPRLGSRIHTHSFLSPDQEFSGERRLGISNFTFRGAGLNEAFKQKFDISYMSRIGFGIVTDLYPDGRDSVMLPFPCFQSDMPIYGGNSGGPVFDEKGRICGINCSSFGGSDISSHMALKGVLELRARNIEFIPEDPVARQRTVFELGLAKRVIFQPSIAKVFFPLYWRILLWPYQKWLGLWDSLRWKLHEAALKASDDAEKKGRSD